MRIVLAIVIALVTLLPACADEEAMREVRDGQRELRAKLDDLEKKIDGIASRPAAPAAAPAQPDPNKVYEIEVGDSPFLGPKDAPVTMIEFSDFQCPFCKSAHELVEQVIEAYPKDLKFVYKEFPLTQIHPHAMNASKAALAAHKQGKYWEMHAKLFENNRALEAENLKKYAGEIGLDVAQWEKDFNSPEIQQQVQDDIKLASSTQVRGTPTIFVNGKRVGNRSFESIKAMVDEALKEKKAG